LVLWMKAEYGHGIDTRTRSRVSDPLHPVVDCKYEDVVSSGLVLVEDDEEMLNPTSDDGSAAGCQHIYCSQMS